MPTENLVFVGDSITDAGRDRAEPDSLGDGYVSLLAAAHPGARIRNLGIAGNRIGDLASRWAADVIPANADTLTIHIGINDTWRRFDSDDPTSAEAFDQGYRSLISGWNAAERPRLILMEPFLLPVRAEQQGWLDDLDAKRHAVASIAQDLDATFVALHAILTAAAQAEGPDALAPDGVHPTARGTRVIADAWMEAYARHA